jgi:ADP-ribose pyrophosphatase YjhB (NUDIX family)
MTLALPSRGLEREARRGPNRSVVGQDVEVQAIDDNPAMVVAGRRFCWCCSEALDRRPPTVCQRCGQAHFNNPKPAGEAVVVDDGRVLLVRRAREPWRGCWDIPGGFCDEGEHPVLAAERELREETGLKGRAIAQIGMWIDSYGEPGPDGMQETSLNVAYLCEAGDGQPAGTADEETLKMAWFALNDLPEPLAFPDHVAPALAGARELLNRPSRSTLQRPESV